MEHFLRSTPGNVHWGLWDGTLPPVLKIASGDRVTIETLSGEPEDLPEPGSGFAVLPDHEEVLTRTFRGSLAWRLRAKTEAKSLPCVPSSRMAPRSAGETSKVRLRSSS